MMQNKGLSDENRHLRRQNHEVQAMHAQATKDIVDQHDMIISLRKQVKELHGALYGDNVSQSQSMSGPVNPYRLGQHDNDASSDVLSQVNEVSELKKLQKQVVILKKSNL